MPVVFEMIRDFDFSAAQTDEIIHLMDSGNGKYVSSGTHRIIKNRNWLIIAPQEQTGVAHLVVEEDQKTIDFPEGSMHWTKKAAKQLTIPSKDPNKISLDAEKIHFPLVLRKWKAGDYFYPLGMKKKKKLARFFIDQKLSRPEKEKVWVLEMNKKILWIVGMRIDDRFKITEKTKTVLKISLETP